MPMVLENLNQSNPLEEPSMVQVQPHVYTEWINQPDLWNRSEFLSLTTGYLLKKNGVVDPADAQLLCILVTQIEIYIQSVEVLKSEGLVVNFNNGVTLGPNPHMTVADKALNRIVQIMKELELSPKARAGYQSNHEMSPAFKKFLAGPLTN